MVSHVDRFWNRPLSIQRLGDFFSDEGFLDYRSPFESAANDFLHDFDLTRHDDAFRSYRSLRERQLAGTDRAAKVVEEKDSYKIVMDVEGYIDSNLEVKVFSPNEIVVEGKLEKSEGSTVSSRSFSRRFNLPSNANLDSATSSLSSDHVLTITVSKKIEQIEEKSSKTSENVKTKIDESFEKSSNFFSDKSFDKFGDDSFWDLKITPRKSFFDDSFFDDVRGNFRKSVDDMMELRNTRVEDKKNVGFFDKIRSKKYDDLQATSVTDHQKEHKIVLDVHGFSENDINVRAVSDFELVVEGKVEKKSTYLSSSSSCSNSFKRKFELPRSVDIRSATAALSSDGVLTITALKKTVDSLDYAIPVRKEAAKHISEIIQKEQVFNNEKIAENKNTKIDDLNLLNSEKVLSDLEKDVEIQKKMCEDFFRKEKSVERTVPINLENKNTLLNQDETCTSKGTTKTKTTESKMEDTSSFKTPEKTSVKEAVDFCTNEHIVPISLADDKTENKSQTINIQTEILEKSSQPQRLSKTVNIETDLSEKRRSLSKEKDSNAKVIPISLKGSFYSDSIFDEARRNIDKEVKNTYERYRKNTDSTNEEISVPVSKSTVSEQKSTISERKSSISEQKSEVSEQKRAVSEEKSLKFIEELSNDSKVLMRDDQSTSTVLEDDKHYKIIVDVLGFKESELKVTLSGLNEISIAGNAEKLKGGSISKHSFQRAFQLPFNVDLDNVVTALSEIGILTVTVPKTSALRSHFSQPITSRIEKETTSTESKISLKNIQKSTEHGPKVTFPDVSSPKVTSPDPCSPTRAPQNEYTVPVTLESAQDARNLRSTSDVFSDISMTSTKDFNTSRDVSQGILSDSTSASSANSQLLNQKKENERNVKVELESIKDSERKLESNLKNTTSVPSDSLKTARKESLFDLPISRKGHFFDDSFFNDSRSVFESSLRDSMRRFEKSDSFVDDLGFFKSLRKNKIAGESQQLDSMTGDDRYNKIVVDVQGYTEKDLRVTVISENEISIEGACEEKIGNSTSRKKFKKQFMLPGKVDLKLATSALSSDGVLTIRVPKIV